MQAKQLLDPNSSPTAAVATEPGPIHVATVLIARLLARQAAAEALRQHLEPEPALDAEANDDL